MKHLIATTLVALGAAAPSLAQNRNASGGALAADQAAYDVKHYDLALRVDPEAQSIEGALTMHATILQPTTSVRLDLDERLEVRSVKSGVQDLEFTRESGELHVTGPIPAMSPGMELSVTIEYGGVPRVAPNPPWDGGFTWKKTRDGEPWIATSCQGEGADLWWPCKDHPSDEPDSMDLHITVPRGLVVATNGKLVSVENADRGWRTHHWHVSTPINNYGVALNIAPYETITKKFKSVAGDSFEFTFWHLPESTKKAKKLFPELIGHMEFFEEVCGPYAFRGDKYGVVETPHLGMEHQSIIAYGNGFRGDPNFDYDWLHHHELSHEWWANLVTARDWSDMWIHESFGTYMQALYLERRFGVDSYHKKMAIDRKRIANRGAVAPRGARPTSHVYFNPEVDDAPGIDVYMKGSWVLHTLRWYAGDEEFFRALRRMAYPDPELEKTIDGSACRFSDTDEILALAEQHTGLELDWFFELYLRQPKLPVLRTEKRGGTLHLEWETPNDMPFPLPVPVRVGRKMQRVEMPEGKGSIQVGGRFEVDPEGWLLKG